MIKPVQAMTGDWKRPARLLVVVIAGLLGIMGRWGAVPRWLVVLGIVSVPAVWVVTRFETHKPGESEADRRRRMRNLAIGLALAGLVVLFYVATMVRLGANVMNRPS